MKKLLATSLFSSLFLFAGNCFAQKENNIWCFGNGCGLDFNSGSPVAFSGVAMTQPEGCSSVADINGNLLFYTDGITVYDRNHLVMPNGTGLWGHASSTQSALIVKHRDNTNIYYVFTTDEDNQSHGFSYSIVDMSLNSGSGDVTTKNVQLFTPSAEKVCATLHSNGKDIWVAGHEMGSNKFRAYLLTAAGLNTVPVISPIGSVYDSTSNIAIGAMKFSHDGKRLAAAIRYLFLTELFNFDNSTGMVTNMIVSIPTTSFPGPYGVEFSPDNTKLYMTDYRLNQYDISSGTADTILAKRVTVGTSRWSLQLAPDGKIYSPQDGKSVLDVISSPNLSGAACGFVAGGLSVSGVAQLGLPVAVAYNARTGIYPDFKASNTVLCITNELGVCINFTNLSVNSTTYKWYFPGATPSQDTAANPTNICYLDTGHYEVKLVAYNDSLSDSITINSYINVYFGPSVPTITRGNDTLYAPQGYANYQWYLDANPISGATNYYHHATQNGIYGLVVTNGDGCTAQAQNKEVILGIHSPDDKQFSVYPNPANDEIYVTGKTGETELTLINMIGEVVFKTVMTDRVKISTVELANGVYWLQFKTEEKFFQTKIIVQH